MRQTYLLLFHSDSAGHQSGYLARRLLIGSRERGVDRLNWCPSDFEVNFRADTLKDRTDAGRPRSGLRSEAEQ